MLNDDVFMSSTEPKLAQHHGNTRPSYTPACPVHTAEPAMDASVESDSTRLKEHLYRAEADRLLLQKKANHLDEQRQELNAEVHTLQQQLAAAHSAYVQLQKQNQETCTTNAVLQSQVESAVREYRANDIICCGLRDTITRLQRQLSDTQETCRQQASEIAGFAEDTQALRQCNTDLTQQLSELQQQHEQLQEDHTQTLKQLADAQQELEASKKRWVAEHGDLARMVQDMQESMVQMQGAMEEQATQRRELEKQLKQQKERVDEFETEVNSVRDLVMVLGKAIGKQPKGQELPTLEDPVWAKLGPLGGVQYALEVVMKHTRAQDATVKGLRADVTRLEDRVRAESAQQAELQSGLYEVRGLYAKAIADRESLEARAARAEAEKAAADTNWQRAKQQAADDTARLQELQESVMSLTKQVQQLLPLQPRCSTLEVERDTAQHKLYRLQEQYDQLQRQMQQAIARESELRTNLDTYKTEHMELLTANAQLVEKCQSLSKKTQVLEINAREATLAVSQLEEAKKRLNTTQNQLEAMSESHAKTLSRLETAKAMLHGTSSSELQSGAGSPYISNPSSRNGSRAGSRHTSTVGAAQDAAQIMASATSGAPPLDAAALSLQAGGATDSPTLSSPAEDQSANVTFDRAASGNVHTPGSQRPHLSVTGAYGRDSLTHGRRSPSPFADDDGGSPLLSDNEIANLPPDVAELLRQKGVEQQLTSKQKKWHEMKVSLLSYFVNQLRKKLLQQAERSAQLEVQLLQQESHFTQLIQQQEQAVSQQCLSAAAEASHALQQLLADLQEALYGPTEQNEAIGSAGAEYQEPGNASASASYASNTGSVGDALGMSIGSAQHEAPSHKQSWLHSALSTMISNLQNVAADAVTRAELIAARQDVAVQSGEPLQTEWLRYIAAIPAGPAVSVHALHQKAIAEAIVRIYVRGMHQLEATWAHELQERQVRPVSRMAGSAACDPAAIAAVAAAGPGGGVSSLYETMMAHYTQQQQHGQHRAWQAYDSSLWKDPQGPISRLLLSCQPLSISSIKVALFCRLVGMHRQPCRGPWGMEHWRHFLLVLHATKRLIGGLWKGVLRDWSSEGGARLPLQCVHDLVGNVYNVSALSELDRLPALLNCKQLLLEQPGLAAAPAKDRQLAGEVSSALAPDGSLSSRASTQGTALSTSRQQQCRGSVTAALQELLVDGPVGPAVDMDDMLGMLMLQYDAGLVPPNPLMEPRRLTDGALANTNNAWGTAALHTGTSSNGASRAASACVAPLAAGIMGFATIEGPPDRADSARSELYMPGSGSGGNSGGGGLCKATTAAVPAGPTGLLPRIKTPDSAAISTRPNSGSGQFGNGSSLPAMAHQSGRPSVMLPTALDTGNSSSNLSSPSTDPGSPGGLKSPVARVALNDARRHSSSKSSLGLKALSNSRT